MIPGELKWPERGPIAQLSPVPEKPTPRARGNYARGGLLPVRQRHDPSHLQRGVPLLVVTNGNVSATPSRLFVVTQGTQ
jgi:hypothetical protein